MPFKIDLDTTSFIEGVSPKTSNIVCRCLAEEDNTLWKIRIIWIKHIADLIHSATYPNIPQKEGNEITPLDEIITIRDMTHLSV